MVMFWSCSGHLLVILEIPPAPQWSYFDHVLVILGLPAGATRPAISHGCVMFGSYFGHLWAPLQPPNIIFVSLCLSFFVIQKGRCSTCGGSAEKHIILLGGSMEEPGPLEEKPGSVLGAQDAH